MMNLKRTFLLVFLGLITIPFYVRVAVRGTTPQTVFASENRTITQFQWPAKTLSRGRLRTWFQNNDRWITDRLVRREFVIAQVNRVLANPSLFSSTDFSRGLFGREHFLFLGNSYAGVIDRHFLKTFEINKENEEKLLEHHKKLQSVAKEVGASYVIFAAPDKHGIFCEKFPDWMTRHGACSRVSLQTERLKAIFEKNGFLFSYPFDALRSRNNELIYYKADTHWKRTGAEIGFLTLFKELTQKGLLFNGKLFKQTAPNTYRFEKTPIGKSGDLRHIIGVPNSYKNDDYNVVLKSNVPLLFSENGAEAKETTAEKIAIRIPTKNWKGAAFNSHAPNKARVLLMGDSFTSAMGAFFYMHFTDSHFYSVNGRSNEKLQAVIREIKPDLVVYESVERGLR